MGLFAMEHGKAAYRADFVLYGTAIVSLATILFIAGPHPHRAESVALVCAGLLSWTAIEYLLHRFVLHGLAPFKRWHEEHHRRPTALICAPTILSASLILILVFLPVLAVGGIWRACALTLGMLTGYLLYAITHHATHHWPAESAWLKRRKRWHAMHHHDAGRLGGFGVTSTFWDHVLGSAHDVATAAASMVDPPGRNEGRAMTYATLMVRVEPGRSNAASLGVAADLANRFDCAVIGIAACEPVQVIYGDGYVPDDLIERDRLEIESELKKAEAEFRRVLRERVEKLEWRSSIAFAPLSDYLAREARCADLFITEASVGGFLSGSRQGSTGDLVMQIGRPVLIVPSVGAAPRFERFVIGWKDSRETRRAVVDALPLLKKAVHVAVVEIATDEDLVRARANVSDVVAWLTHHKVAAQALALPSAGSDGDQLANVAQQQGADVLIAGAYGHSRLREWALGGVTRDLLMRGDRCVLLAH